MAPFTIGNVLNTSIKNMWLEKGINAWQSQEVQDYINSIDEDKQTSNIKNHVDVDIAL